MTYSHPMGIMTYPHPMGIMTYPHPMGIVTYPHPMGIMTYAHCPSTTHARRLQPLLPLSSQSPAQYGDLAAPAVSFLREQRFLRQSVAGSCPCARGTSGHPAQPVPPEKGAMLCYRDKQNHSNGHAVYCITWAES